MILLDTSLIYAIYDIDDPNHKTAKDIFKRIFGGMYAQPVLLDYVYNELLTLLYVRSKNFDLCIQVSKILNTLIARDKIIFVYTPTDVFWKAYEVFVNQNIENQSKFLSYTDAIIGSMISWLNAEYVGTFDSQFYRFPAKVISE